MENSELGNATALFRLPHSRLPVRLLPVQMLHNLWSFSNVTPYIVGGGWRK
jgi:hypothetical protein